MLIALLIVTFVFLMILAAVRLFLPGKIQRQPVLMTGGGIASFSLLFPLLGEMDSQSGSFSPGVVLALWLAMLGVSLFCFLLSLFPSSTWGMVDEAPPRKVSRGKES